MNSILESARHVLASQPFSRLLGTELTEFGPDGVELTLQLNDDLLQQNGFAHGGVLSYLADNALTFAGGIALGPDILTSEFKINYLRPATGPLLTARARPVSGGKRQAVCVCEISTTADGETKLCALAQGTIARR